MLLIYFLFFGLKIIFDSQSYSSSSFSRKDCYESISDSSQKLVVESDFPVNPPYLRAKVHFVLHPSNSHVKEIDLHAEHHFMRVDEPCQSTMEYTAKGIPFERIFIHMDLYNDIKDDNKIAVISYRFNSLISGLHKLFDTKMHFGFPVYILNDGSEHIKMTNHSLEHAISHLKTLDEDNHDLCLVTENNRAVVIRPFYLGTKPNGLVTHVIATHSTNGVVVEAARFPAFECKTNQEDPLDMVVFVEEKIRLKAKIHYTAHYMSSSEELYEKYATFRIPNAEYLDLKKSRSLSRDVKKLYLMHTGAVVRKCPDDSKRIIFVSANGTPYYAKELEEIEVTYGMIRMQWFSRNPLEPCSA